MKPEALVILTPGFPADEGDTTCLPPRQMFVKALKNAYPDVQLIVLSFQYPFRTDTYNWNGVQVISFGGKDWGKGFRLITWLRVGLKLAKLKNQYKILGLLSFWLGECALVGKYLGRWFGLKHFIWLLGQDAKSNNRYFKRIRPNGHELIALSDFIAGKFYRNYHIRPMQTIPVGIDTALFNKKARHRDIDILGAGSLIPLKQYELFIEAVRFATYFFPGLNAVICGKGPEKEKLLFLIAQYKLEKNITLLDEIPHRDVLKLMQSSKIFLHTSSYEGFGTVLAEALYAGTQVVSFCKPMKGNADHHHVVTDINMMQNQLINLLKQTTLDHQPVLLHSAPDVAKQVMELYQPVI